MNDHKRELYVFFCVCLHKEMLGTSACFAIHRVNCIVNIACSTGKATRHTWLAGLSCISPSVA